MGFANLWSDLVLVLIEELAALIRDGIELARRMAMDAIGTEEVPESPLSKLLGRCPACQGTLQIAAPHQLDDHGIFRPITTHTIDVDPRNSLTGIPTLQN